MLSNYEPMLVFCRLFCAEQEIILVKRFAQSFLVDLYVVSTWFSDIFGASA